MQRHTAFAIPFFTSDFNTVQTTTGHNLNALSTQTHCILHRTAEHNTLFELLSDRISDQLRIDFWLANFFDVDVNWHAHHFRQFSFQYFNIFAFFTDYNAWTGAVNSNTCVFRWTLNSDAA